MVTKFKPSGPSQQVLLKHIYGSLVHNLTNHTPSQLYRLPEIGVKSLDEIYGMEDLKIKNLLGPDAERWLIARQSLLLDPHGLSGLKERVLLDSSHRQDEASSWERKWTCGKVLIESTFYLGIDMGLIETYYNVLHLQ